jgi:hypothetical protein
MAHTLRQGSRLLQILPCAEAENNFALLPIAQLKRYLDSTAGIEPCA